MEAVSLGSGLGLSQRLPIATSGMLTKLRAYIIEPDLGARQRLRRTALDLLCYEEPKLFESPEKALLELVYESRCDIVFLSARLSLEDCFAYVKKAKQMHAGRDAAHVLVIDGAQRQQALLSRCLMAGISGFLAEPYSTESLAEMTTLARHVKVHNELERHNVAFGMIRLQINALLDLTAELTRLGFQPKRTHQALADACAVLKSLTPESFELFYCMLADALKDTPPSPALPEDFHYSGTSNRVRQQIERDLLQRVQEKVAAERARLGKGG